MAARIDILLKLSTVVALLIAASAIGYYYGFYLPNRDAQRHTEHVSQQLLAYGQMRVEETRLAAEQQQAERRKTADHAAAEGRYRTCLARAAAAHETSWSAQCKHLADEIAQDRAGCLANAKLPSGYCNASYRPRDASPNCILPLDISSDLDGDLALARRRCLQERNAALQ